MNKLAQVAILLATIPLVMGISYLFALAGEPSALWLWRILGVLS